MGSLLGSWPWLLPAPVVSTVRRTSLRQTWRGHHRAMTSPPSSSSSCAAFRYQRTRWIPAERGVFLSLSGHSADRALQGVGAKGDRQQFGAVIVSHRALFIFQFKTVDLRCIFLKGSIVVVDGDFNTGLL